MNVCIVGGGHIGTTLACYIKHTDSKKQVAIYTRQPEKFSENIKCNDIENNISFDVKLDVISSDASVAAQNADIVFIALPHFAVEKAFEDIAPYVANDAFIGVIPGGGGCEFYFEKYFAHTNSLFGFQRVPFTAKLVEYGKETNLKSWKPFSVVGTLYKDRLEDACFRIESCGLKTKKADNYLAIALTPTNPVLHTSRIYDIFGKYARNYEFDHHCKFYVGWTDDASKTLLEMDRELHTLLEAIPELDTTAIRPLAEHYEAPTIEAMTRKINGIATFQTVLAPMKPVQGKENAYVADTSSRMFAEDFPWGLAVIGAYCKLFDIDSPVMDSVLKWYAEYMGLEWYVDGKFCGRDLNKTGIPLRYGIQTKEELLKYYIK